MGAYCLCFLGKDLGYYVCSETSILGVALLPFCLGMNGRIRAFLRCSFVQCRGSQRSGRVGGFRGVGVCLDSIQIK
jgi:hypothetical protein